MIVIFGNKSDIEKNQRQVSSEEIEQYMKQKNLIYFETSAKTGKGIDEGFSYIANEVYDKTSLKDNARIQLINKSNDNYEFTTGCFGLKKRKKKKVNSK